MEARDVIPIEAISRSPLLRGIIRAFDETSYRADVQIIGSRAHWTTAIPVSRGIPVNELQPGCRCAIVSFEDNNPDDAMVVGVW